MIRFGTEGMDLHEISVEPIGNASNDGSRRFGDAGAEYEESGRWDG